jgi:hypothetical protein
VGVRPIPDCKVSELSSPRRFSLLNHQHLFFRHKDLGANLGAPASCATIRALVLLVRPDTASFLGNLALRVRACSLSTVLSFPARGSAAGRSSLEDCHHVVDFEVAVFVEALVAGIQYGEDIAGIEIGIEGRDIVGSERRNIRVVGGRSSERKRDGAENSKPHKDVAEGKHSDGCDVIVLFLWNERRYIVGLMRW